MKLRPSFFEVACELMCVSKSPGQPMPVCVIGAGVAMLIGGCGLLGTFDAGSFAGEIPCTLAVEGEDGQPAGQEDFAAPLSFVVGDDGSFTINSVVVEVGAEVTRAIPNAELSFEISDVRRHGRFLRVTYEPRPTLPGISVTGELVETYHAAEGGVVASATADLEVTDIEGPVEFTVDCQGTLIPNSP